MKLKITLIKQIIPPALHIEITDNKNNNIKKLMMLLPYSGNF